MKFLINELYTKCFFGTQYEESEDKFLIGYLNNEGNKLKDVVTGQIVEGEYFSSLTSLKSFRNDGNHMALGYMTGLRASDASIRQRLLARIIDSTLNGDTIDLNQITRIKNIINKEVVNTHKQEEYKQKVEDQARQSLQQYSIDESEKDF